VRVRIRLWWRRYWWAVLGAVGLLAFALAVVGAEAGSSVLDRLNTGLHLLPLGFAGGRAESGDPSLELQLARLLAPLVFAYATYRAVIALFVERVHDVRARFKRGHTVVCGLGNQGQTLVESLLGSKKVVAIERDPTNPAVGRLRDAGAVVIVGDSTDPLSIDRARMRAARHVVSVCGSDAVNAQVGANILALLDPLSTRSLDTFVHIADPRLYRFLLHHSLSRAGPRLEFFNVYERGAQSFLQEARERLDPARAVLVLGGGQFGLALVSLLARERYAALGSTQDGRALRLYLVDREAGARAELLSARYSRLADVCTVEPVEIDVDSPEFDGLLERRPALAEVDVAYVCFDNDSLTIATTLSLLDQARGRFPVVARVSQRTEGIAGMIGEAQSRYAAADIFRPLSIAHACRADLVLEGMRGQLARQVHETYRKRFPGGPHDVPWDELTEEGKQRNLAHGDAPARGCRVSPRTVGRLGRSTGRTRSRRGRAHGRDGARALGRGASSAGLQLRAGAKRRPRARAPQASGSGRVVEARSPGGSSD